MSATRVILVGGFLGAGKTTLLRAAARRLAGSGRRVGLVTNDQAPELVDTALLERDGAAVAEVSGSCFCCNFDGLIGALRQARDAAGADVLIAEPVGSCTDLSATVVQPLKDRHAAEFEVAPLTVAADPARLSDILRGGTSGLHPSAAYIFRKQLEEADLIAAGKSDTLPTAEAGSLLHRLSHAYPAAVAMTLSAISGDGLDAWLREVTTRSGAGRRLAEVDYDTYAEGEAVLGWLNATVRLRGPKSVDWRAFASALLSGLGRRFDGGNASVGHVKLMIQSGGEFLTGNLTGPLDTLSISGAAFHTSDARLTLNARVQMPPEALDAVARECLAAACGEAVMAVPLAWRCLMPGRPRPTHRYGRVVDAR